MAYTQQDLEKLRKKLFRYPSRAERRKDEETFPAAYAMHEAARDMGNPDKLNAWREYAKGNPALARYADRPDFLAFSTQPELAAANQQAAVNKWHESLRGQALSAMGGPAVGPGSVVPEGWKSPAEREAERKAQAAVEIKRLAEAEAARRREAEKPPMMDVALELGHDRQARGLGGTMWDPQQGKWTTPEEERAKWAAQDRRETAIQEGIRDVGAAGRVAAAEENADEQQRRMGQVMNLADVRTGMGFTAGRREAERARDKIAAQTERATAAERAHKMGMANIAAGRDIRTERAVQKAMEAEKERQSKENVARIGATSRENVATTKAQTEAEKLEWKKQVDAMNLKLKENAGKTDEATLQLRRDALEATIKQNKETNEPLILPQADGTTKTLYVKAGKLVDEKGNPVQSMGMLDQLLLNTTAIQMSGAGGGGGSFWSGLLGGGSPAAPAAQPAPSQPAPAAPAGGPAPVAPVLSPGTGGGQTPPGAPAAGGVAGAGQVFTDPKSGRKYTRDANGKVTWLPNQT